MMWEEEEEEEEAWVSQGRWGEYQQATRDEEQAGCLGGFLALFNL